MVPLSFAGHTLLPLPDGALFWPARRALLVADLHLEKASWFAARGQMLPPYDSVKTLDDLAGAVEASDAKRGLVPGRLVSTTRHGCDRLPADARALLERLTARDGLDLDHRQSRSAARTRAVRRAGAGGGIG